MDLRKTKSPTASCSQEQTPGLPSSPPFWTPESCSTTAAYFAPWAKTSLFMDTVKSVLVDIVEGVIHRYREEICNGCRVSHPGQRQHDCLNDMPDFFFRNNYNALMKKRSMPSWMEKKKTNNLRLIEARDFFFFDTLTFSLK